MSEFARVRERMRQTRAALVRTLPSNGSKPACPEGRIGCTFAPGARVFDRISGQEGEVVGGTRENVVVSTSDKSDR